MYPNASSGNEPGGPVVLLCLVAGAGPAASTGCRVSRVCGLGTPYPDGAPVLRHFAHGRSPSVPHSPGRRMNPVSTPEPDPHPAPQNPAPQSWEPRRPEFAPPLPPDLPHPGPRLAEQGPGGQGPGSQTPGTPTRRSDPPETGPGGIWYGVGAMFFPVALLTWILLLLALGRDLAFAWIALPLGAVVVTAGWMATVYLLRDRSQRRRKSLLPPPPALVHAAAYPGGPTYPVWFQPRTAPPLEPRNLRPRRLWYGLAVLLVLLWSPASAIAANVVADWFGFVLSLLIPLGTLTLVVVVMLRRARDRRRIAREHLAQEWEQAHRG